MILMYFTWLLAFPSDPFIIRGFFRWEGLRGSELSCSVTYGIFLQCYVGKRNGPLKETKRLGTYEIPVRLHQTFLLKFFVLHASNSMGVKCSLVILTVPFSAMSLCCRCQKCFERNCNDFWKLVSSSGKEILLLNLWERAFMRYNDCSVFGDWWNLNIHIPGFTTASFTPIC